MQGGRASSLIHWLVNERMVLGAQCTVGYVPSGVKGRQWLADTHWCIVGLVTVGGLFCLTGTTPPALSFRWDHTTTVPAITSFTLLFSSVNFLNQNVKWLVLQLPCVEDSISHSAVRVIADNWCLFLALEPPLEALGQHKTFSQCYWDALLVL